MTEHELVALLKGIAGEVRGFVEHSLKPLVEKQAALEARVAELEKQLAEKEREA